MAEAIARILRQPGAMKDISGTAPIHLLVLGKGSSNNNRDTVSLDTAALIRSSPGYAPAFKPRFLDRQLDRVVEASGSVPAFAVIQLALLGWALSGIAFSSTDLWPVLISDVQAIFSYVFDSLLMRQQLNSYAENLRIAAQIRSRGLTLRRLLRLVVGRRGEGVKEGDVGKVVVMETIVVEMEQGVEIGRTVEIERTIEMEKTVETYDTDMPAQSRFDRVIDMMALIVGHVGFVAVYWVAVFVWLGFGPSNQWSNQWQLDINSATSALMIFIFSFLAILRERDAKYTRTCVDTIYRLDATLEAKLRALTNDESNHLEVTIAAPKVNPMQRAINYYADVVGTLAGIALLLIVTVIWVALGPVLDWSANWWLTIGTYTGLVGLNDGFVMRNIQAKLRCHESPQYAEIDSADRALVEILGDAPESTTPVNAASLSFRVSERMNKICGHEMMVIAGVLLIGGLLVGSSVMRWSETGQLLSNVPPSIIESFFMVILITGHNAADAQRRADLANMLQRRLQVLAFVDSLGMV